MMLKIYVKDISLDPLFAKELVDRLPPTQGPTSTVTSLIPTMTSLTNPYYDVTNPTQGPTTTMTLLIPTLTSLAPT